MDTAILAALIGAAATIASTWLSHWSPRSGVSSGHAPPVDQTAVPTPTGWRWVGCLCWDVARLSLRNVCVFVMFVALLAAVQQLGVGKPTPEPAGGRRESGPFGRAPRPEDTWMLLGMFGAAAAAGLGVAEALTRWSPSRLSPPVAPGARDPVAVPAAARAEPDAAPNPVT